MYEAEHYYTKSSGFGYNFYPLANEVAKGYSNATICPSVRRTKFSQNPLKDVDSRVFIRMLCGKNLIW
jgi:hypothetical protein